MPNEINIDPAVMQPLVDLKEEIVCELQFMRWYATLIALCMIYFAVQDMSDKYCWPSVGPHTPEWCKPVKVEIRTK